MGTKYATGKVAIAICDRCGFKYQYKKLRKLTVKTKQVDLKVCPSCYEPDHPQYKIGMFPVHDFQALREPRTDSSYDQAGLNGLHIGNISAGVPTGGSRDIQWGWNPVGGASSYDTTLTPNNLISKASVGLVSVETI